MRFPRHRLWLFVLGTTLFVGCKGLSDFLFDGSGEVGALAANATSVPADGATLITFSVELASGIYDAGIASRRSVTFQTTMGEWIGGDGTELVALVNSHGRADAVLRAPTERGVARVSVFAGDSVVVQTTSIEFIQAPPERIELAAAPFRVSPVDPDAEVELTARLRREHGQVSDNIVVSFEARTAGGGSAGRIVDVSSSADGVATARYRPEDTTYRGEVIIRAWIDIAGTRIEGRTSVFLSDAIEEEEDEETTIQDEVDGLVASAPSAPADGSTLITLTASVRAGNAEGGTSPRTITFSTTLGSWLGGGDDIEVPVDVNGRAQALLQAPTQVGTALINAVVANSTSARSASVQFTVANPNRIEVAVDPIRVTPDEDTEIQVVASLFLSRGQVSDGIFVSFSAVTTTGAPLGRFIDVVPSSDGTASAILRTEDTTYRGEVTVRASVGGIVGSTLLFLED